MINPFQYGGIVGPEAFCNRAQELHDLKRAATNGDRLLIYAERRLGKTSLVKHVLDSLSKQDFLPIYIDLWATGGTASFVKTAAKAIAEAAATRADKLLETSKELFRHLIPSLTLDESGNPLIQFGARSGIERERALEDVLEAPAKLAQKHSRRVVVVYDEIQQIMDYGDDTVERTLRSHMQMHQRIAYFLLGSRKHLIQRLFRDRNRPLYQSAGFYPLGPIRTEDWVPFIRERFEAARKPMAEAHIEALCAWTEGHPFYTQHLAHAVWEITPEGEAVTEETLQAALALLLRRVSYPYMVLWESLTSNQQQLLWGLAAEVLPAKPFAQAFLKKYDLAASSAHRAAAGLLERDVVDREGEGFIISDRFFRLWIQRL